MDQFCISAKHLFGLPEQCRLSERTCPSIVRKFVTCVGGWLHHGCLVVIGTPVPHLSPSQLMRSSHSTGSEVVCAVKPSPPCPGNKLPPTRPRGSRPEGVEQLPGAHPIGSDQLTAWCKSRWWRRELCCFSLRGGMRMAQRLFRLADPRQASP